MHKERNISLDIIRILACFMVVLMHSPIPSENAIGPFLTVLSYITAPCIGLFFMVSGALLLPVKTDYKTFLKKRFSKIVIPTILWSVIYIALRLYYSESEIGLIRQLCSIPFSAQGEGVLWFMYTLSGLYLLAPILSAWVQKASKSELEFVLGLWAVTLCYPLISQLVEINQSETGILYYFTGYAGYFLLGYYLYRYPSNKLLLPSLVISASGGILIIWLKYVGMEFDFYSLFWYQSIFVVALALATWLIVFELSRYVTGKYTPMVMRISNISFGIYLVHILIMRRWLWNVTFIHNIGSYILQTVLIAIITFAISSIICAVISHISGSQWIIGHRAKK